MKYIPVLSLLFFLSLASTSASAQGLAESIKLSASPESLPADGYSTAVITAEVRERSGALVPDGTDVSFSASVGTVSPTSTVTRSGRARVRLTSASVPGTAVVTAFSGRAVRTLTVILYPPEEKAVQARVNVITVSGDYVAYSSELQVMQADGRVRISLGAVEVFCSSAQIDLGRNMLKAVSPVGGDPLVISSGKTSWRGRGLWYDWVRRAGAIRGFEALSEDIPESFAFVGPPLVRLPSGDIQPSEFEFRDLEETELWIVCRWAAIFPGQRIHFRSAEIRPGGERLLKLRYHSLPLGETGDEDQYLGLGPSGIALDIPYYFSLSDRSASSVRLGLNQREGSFGAVKGGLGIDLRHRIFVGDRGEEVVNLSRITSRDWGVWWRHSRQWSSSLSTSAFVEYPSHRDLFATGNLDWDSPGYSGFLNLSASILKEAGSIYFGDLALQTHPRRMGASRFFYSFLSGTGWSGGPGVRDEIRQSLSVRISMSPLTLGKKSSLSASVTGGRVITGIRRGAKVDAVVSLSHRFAPTVFASMSYTLSDRPGLGAGASRQRASLLFTGQHRRTSLSASVTKALDMRSLTFAGQYSYWLSRRWRADIRTILLRYTGYRFSDYEIALAYPVGQRELLLFWSKSRHRFMVELSGFSF
ncbi:MAG: Ig-like domain-containing protein [Armatimonadota bacterium]